MLEHNNQNRITFNKKKVFCLQMTIGFWTWWKKSSIT